MAAGRRPDFGNAGFLSRIRIPVNTTDDMTLADLPFRVLERFPKPDTCAGAGNRTARACPISSSSSTCGRSAWGCGPSASKPGDRVALASESRPEWVVSDLAVITAGAVTVPLYPTLSAPQMWFILNETEARIAIVSNAAQVAKIREVDERSHALRTIVVIDGEVEPGAVPRADDGRRRGHRRADAGGRSRDRRPLPRRSGRRIARRARHDRLHLRHDGRPEGRHADAPQHRLERDRDAGVDRPRPDRPAAVVPPAQPRLRARRPVPLPLRRRQRLLRGDDDERRTRSAAGEADRDDRRAAGVGEVPRRHPGWAGQDRGSAEEAGRVGHRRRLRVGARLAVGRDAFAAAQGEAGGRRPAGVREDPRTAGRDDPLPRVGQRAALAEDRRVLLRDQRADPRGLRPDREFAGHLREPAGRAAARHGGQAAARRRGPHRARRRDPGARSEHHAGLLQASRGDGRDAGRRLAPHRRHRGARAPTATSRSPTERRT